LCAIAWPKSAVLPDDLDGFSTGVANVHLQGHLPGQGMGGAAKAGVVGPEGHPNPV